MIPESDHGTAPLAHASHAGGGIMGNQRRRIKRDGAADAAADSHRCFAAFLFRRASLGPGKLEFRPPAVHLLRRLGLPRFRGLSRLLRFSQ